MFTFPKQNSAYAIRTGACGMWFNTSYYNGNTFGLKELYIQSHYPIQCYYNSYDVQSHYPIQCYYNSYDDCAQQFKKET